MTSIFTDENKVSSMYWAPKEIGDSIEGTFIEKRVVVNRMKENEDQNVYTLKTADGEIVDVYGKKGIDMQMRGVRLGQVIGFKFTEKRPSKTPGMFPTNVIQVYANPDVVDEAWLKEQEDNQSAYANEDQETDAPQTAEEVPAKTEGTPTVVAPTVDDTLREINNIMIEKFGAKTPDEVKNMAMEKTGLAFIESNLGAILEAIKAL